MNRVIAKKKAIERINNVIAIANDEGRSMVERGSSRATTPSTSCSSSTTLRTCLT